MKKFLFLFCLCFFLIGCGRQNNLLSQPSVYLSGSESGLIYSDVTNTEISTYISSGDVIGPSDSLVITGPLDIKTQDMFSTGNYFKTYHSLDLGFEFSVSVYSSVYPNWYYLLVRSGSAVFFGQSDYDELYSNIERFEKLSTETVEQAIKRLFLAEYDKKCFLQSNEGFLNNTRYRSFVIDYPLDEKAECIEGMCYPSQFCSKYAGDDRIGFFLGQDSSDHFYFVDAGQDPLMGLDGNPWYSSIKLF
ncbi:hypothetical protein P148_SR1C00001G0914 [candidate division SR1 bacterium RAAC1_SR1_1]|nr:hypothetical protein P148_SR1C00001G0914 [candidate division SR1 bacterium RAAC1_SR1_1]